MKVTVEYKTDAGQVHTVVYDEAAGTAFYQGATMPMKMAANTITIETPGGPLVLTLEKQGGGPPTVGASSRYSASNGDKGEARVTAVA